MIVSYESPVSTYVGLWLFGLFIHSYSTRVSQCGKGFSEKNALVVMGTSRNHK